jgi:hypothetical protein
MFFKVPDSMVLPISLLLFSSTHTPLTHSDKSATLALLGPTSSRKIDVLYLKIIKKWSCNQNTALF